MTQDTSVLRLKFVAIYSARELRISSAVLVQTNGWGFSFQC